MTVDLPDAVLAIEGEGLPRQVLRGVCSVVTRPRPQVVTGYRHDAAAHLWSTGDSWRLQVADAPAIDLSPGDTFTADSRRFVAVAVSLEAAARSQTHVQGGVAPPLRIIAHFDTVHIHVDAEPVLVLNGLPARIVSELVSFDGPVHWEVLAHEVWRGEEDRMLLRSKLDVNLSRLRRKLRDARVRPDLVRSDGAGQIELFLRQSDRVDDRT